MDSTSERVARLRAFLSRDPGNASLACDLADGLIADGGLAEAGRVLASLPGPARGEPGVRFRVARVALMQGDYAQAEQDYRALLADGHDAAAVRHDLAFSELCQRKAEDAYAGAQAACERFGGSAALEVLKARAALMLERYDVAQADIAKAVALEPGNADVLGVASLVYLDGGEMDRAGTSAAAALAIDADQHEALMVAGTLALWQQRADAAVDLFEQALRRHPNSGRVLSGLGQALMLRQELVRANEVLERAVIAMPDHIGTWHALAWAQLLQGNIDAAEASYESAYALDRNFGDTHGGLALIAALRGRPDDAEQHVKRALRLDPNAVTARYAQTLVLESRGDAPQAEAAMEALLASTGTANGLPPAEFARRLHRTLQSGVR
jgi:tetratricopeptide (TPR) repeat protein